MSARHATLLAALAAIWGGSYLLIKYALDGFSAAMIVSARSLLASAVLFVVLRAQGLAARDAARRARAAEVGADPRRDRGRGAVPADHLRRARRAERADRGADLARLAVRRAAGAVHPADASRSTAARASACCSAWPAWRSSSASSRCSTLEEFLGALAMIGAAFFYGLSSFVVKGRYGTLAAVQTSWISVTVAGVLTLPVGDRHDARPHARPRRDRRARRARRGRHRARVRHLLRADQRDRRRRAPRWSPTSRPGVALFYGAIFLDEKITVAAVGGLVLILGGVAIASRPKRVPAPVARAGARPTRRC